MANAKPTDTHRDLSSETMCPVCGCVFVASGRKVYCSQSCKHVAYRRRHQTVVVVKVPHNRPRGPITVYECASCGQRLLGQQRCEDCGLFMSRVGPGGLCPHCDDPVAISDLITEEAQLTMK